MSISCRREPDPFNLPPRGWACYGVEKISSDEKDRVRILAENGDGCAMVRYAAVCMEDGGVEWFKRALLYGERVAFQTLDYWICALGLCTMTSPDSIKEHMGYWLDRMRDEFDITEYSRAMMVQRYGESVVRAVMAPKVEKILNKLSDFARDDSCDRKIVCCLLLAAFQGDQEALYYICEGIRRLQKTSHMMYKTKAVEKCCAIVQRDDDRFVLIEDKVQRERQMGFRPSAQAKAEKADLERRERVAEKEKAERERAEYCREMRELEVAVRALERPNQCCECGEELHGIEASVEMKFSHAKRLSDGSSAPVTLTVCAPRCDRCANKYVERRREFEEEINKRKMLEKSEKALQAKYDMVFMIAAWVMLLAPVAAWPWIKEWAIAIEIISIAFLCRFHDWKTGRAQRKMKKKWKHVDQPSSCWYSEYPPIVSLKKRGFQMGEKYVEPCIRW